MNATREKMRLAEEQLDADYARSRLNYDPNSGEFRSKARWGSGMKAKADHTPKNPGRPAKDSNRPLKTLKQQGQ
jgi:hypothetical protein